VDGIDLGRVDLQEGVVVDLSQEEELRVEPEGELQLQSGDESSGSLGSLELFSDSEDSTFSSFSCLPQLPRTESEQYRGIFSSESDALESESE